MPIKTNNSQTKTSKKINRQQYYFFNNSSIASDSSKHWVDVINSSSLKLTSFNIVLDMDLFGTFILSKPGYII